MSIDSAISIAWDVLKCVVAPIKRGFGFVMSSESYANHLREEVKKLEHEAERIHHAMEEARDNLRNVYSRATELQASSENALKEAQDLLGDFEKATKTCCYGTLPDPSCRYQFSKKANHKTEDIKRLTANCRELYISYSRTPPGNVAGPTSARREGKDVIRPTTATASASFASTSIKLRDDGIFESRTSVIQKIMDALADNNNSVVGVHGMGGVGKSTLLVVAEKRIKENKLFDRVAKADVSENPDIKKIQDEIAHWLGLSDIKKEENISLRAKLLRERLENEQRNEKKVLIILDNLWKPLNLRLVGIPCGLDNKVIGCKLLLTSRDLHILQTEMGCDRDFYLGVLQKEEARGLFERMVGDKVHDEEFIPLVDEALRKCAGLPLLIVTMAKHLKNATSSRWRDALNQIERSTNEGISGVINKVLQLSYDHLESKDAKSLLQLCAAYGVSKPSIENLVRYGFGWGIFPKDMSMKEARDRLNTLINRLQASSLLLENGGTDAFEIHDLVRDFVAQFVLRDHPLLFLKDKDKLATQLRKERLKSCMAICFLYIDIKELPQELDCPEMRILLLFTNNKSLEVPDSYFNSMRKLAVLNLTGVRLTRSSMPFQFLENLGTLNLQSCSLEDVAILGELKGLQILSFVNSKIERLPKEIGQLTELRLLDLNHCSCLQIIEPGVLGRLINLEELYMKNSFNQWNPVEQTHPTNASLMELNDMKNLCILHISIPNLSVLPWDLNFEKLTKYNIQIGDCKMLNLWPWSSKYKGSRTLELNLNLASDILQRGCIRTTLDIIDDLWMDGLKGNEQSICQLSLKGFPQLKCLHVQNSPSIHYILKWSSIPIFKSLELLFLESLINLEKLCHNNIFSKSFSALKVVQVKCCHKMEVLIPLSLPMELPQLEEIEVANCNLMWGIVEADDCGKVKLRNLHILKLYGLPNMKNFFTVRTAPSSSTPNDQVGTQIAFFNGQQISIPSLESLAMEGLPNMKEIWSDESPLELSNLRSLTLVRCNSLLKVISSQQLVKLHKLHNLYIRDCNSMQQIFDLDEPSTGEDLQALSELTTLELNKLGSLRHIWNKNPFGIVSLHNLKKLEVVHCDNLGFMFFPSMVKSLAQLRDLMIQNCKKMEAIVMEEEGLGLEALQTLAFPMLANLTLNYLENLKCFSLGKCSREARSQDSVKSRPAALFNREVAFQKLETLKIHGLASLVFIFFPSMVKSLTQLKKLTVSDCENMKAIIMEEEGLGMETSEILAFPMLTDLHLVRLKSLTCFSHRKCARESDSQDCVRSRTTALFNQEVAFPNLENLYIKGMDNIKMIWHDPIHADSFSKLKLISVNECKKLVNVVPSFILGRLLSLETLMAKGCDALEVVFKLQPLNPLDGNSVARSPLKELKLDDLSMLNFVWDKQLYHHIKFQCLHFVTLQRCARLTSLFSTSIASDLIQLEELEINQCSIVELIEKEGPSELSINVEAIEGPSHELKVASPFPSYFQHMKTLDVSYCYGLSNMFTPTMVTNLVGLTKLRISKCEILTEVISDEGGKEGHVVAFNQLTYMELDGLTSLRCFNSSGYTLMFPLLEDIIVNRCPKMKFFSEGPMEAPKLERVQVGLNEGYQATECQYFWKENLNTTIQNMLEEMLSEFPELIEKWHSELNPVTSSWQLKSLVVGECPFIYAIPSRLMLVLKRMTTLQVHNCEPLEEIFDLEGLEVVDCTQVLPQLRSMCLVNLPKLKQLWNRDLQGTMCFTSLQHLRLYKCNTLRHVFVPSMARCLPSLRWMEIKECNQMEGVIVDEHGPGSMVEEITSSYLEEITFPYLKRINLECLPNLTSFLSWKNHTLECPILSILRIAHCPKMRSLTWQSSMEIDNGTPSLFTPQVQFPQLMRMDLSHMDNLSKIWTDGPLETLTFDCLWEVKVLNCKSLENLFPYWVATSLTQLGKLQVESCEIEEIVASGDDTPCSNTTQDLFPKLTSLVLHDMPQLKSFCPNLPLNLPLLKKLRVTHCEKLSMLSFVASMNRWAQRDDQQDLSDQEAHSSFERDFPNLERLLLVNNNIQMIQDGNFSDDMFSKLKALTLACFHDKKAAFPSIFLLERFQNLQSLEVFCSSFEDLFPNEGIVEERKHPVLENLRELKLNKLHNLKCVWKEDSLVSKILQSIETFKIWDCPCLTTIFPTETSFQNLTNLVVKNSSGLVHLVTTSAVINLVHLTYMTIIGCEIMKEVVANDGNREGKVISFEKLECLTLEHLPNLECFSSISSCIFRFPSLWNIEVEECPKMKNFSKGTLSTPKLVDVTVQIQVGRELGEG